MTQQSIHVGGRQVPLPEEVDLAQWSLERVRWQNPRIRALLGCVRLIEEVMDSNFAILHCSPERLRKIRLQAARVSTLIRGDIAPLLAAPSKMPRLESALRAAEDALRHLDATALAEIERLATSPEELDLVETRKLLCVAIGKIHSFLQDTFGQIMEADPRSLYDADYFLSQRFRRDIEEAEWLYATVDRLQTLVKTLGPASAERLLELSESLLSERRFDDDGHWEEASSVIRAMHDELLPLLKEVLALKGIRFDEMEMLDRHADEIPARCTLVLELRQLGRRVEKRSAAVDDGLAAARELLCERLAALLEQLGRSLQDLLAFVPLWLNNIALRRALMLERPAK